MAADPSETPVDASEAAPDAQDVQKRLKALSADYDLLTAEVEDLRRQVDAWRSHCHGLESDLAIAASESSRLQDEIDDLKEKLDGTIGLDGQDAVELAEWVLERIGPCVEDAIVRDVAEWLLQAGRRAGRD
jgi:predicted nuclease with TOPRIM domain